MSVSITGKYLGNKKVQIQHGPSKVEIITAAPLDNNGDGSSFSPSDLTASSVAACMMTIMAILADRDNIDLGGSHFALEKHMQNSPRRIAKIPITFHLPKSLVDDERKKLEVAAMRCPVHHSLLPDIEVNVEFVYDIT